MTVIRTQNRILCFRFQRASSVQRQTDTLRRLAQQRDVAQRLQTPAPQNLMRPERPHARGTGDCDSGGMIITNPMAAGYAMGGDGGGGGVTPVLLLSDNGGGVSLSENGDLAIGGAGASRRNRRPVPPPYASSAAADSSILRASVRAERDGTYLV